MAYTAFRKSYGDFEVVIPPVRFRIAPEYVAHAAKELRSYEIELEYGLKPHPYVLEEH